MTPSKTACTAAALHCASVSKRIAAERWENNPDVAAMRVRDSRAYATIFNQLATGRVASARKTWRNLDTAARDDIRAHLAGPTMAHVASVFEIEWIG